MKVRESGMPEESVWNRFFAPDHILDAMGLTDAVRDAVDFGCGYGTFALPAARRIQGTLYAFDIEPTMIEATRALAAREPLHNVRVIARDFVADGTALEAESIDYVMLFNILHAETPVGLLNEAYRILAPGGRVGVIHWNYDPDTPRGPPMSMRPRPEACCRWISDAGFIIEQPQITLPPYHYGIVARKGKRDL